MKHVVYILENRDGRHYIGYTANLERRMKDHNSSKTKWTKGKGPWHLVHSETFQNKKSAFLREKQIKRYKGGKAFRLLLEKCKS